MGYGSRSFNACLLLCPQLYLLLLLLLVVLVLVGVLVLVRLPVQIVIRLLILLVRVQVVVLYVVCMRCLRQRGAKSKGWRARCGWSTWNSCIV